MQGMGVFASQAHRLVESGLGVPAEFLPADLYQSWTRCVTAGLDPSRPPPPVVEGAVHLREARDAHALLRRYATAEMSALQTRMAGTSVVLALASPDGLVLDVMADRYGIASEAEAVQAGSLWSEAQSGTNALGVAAIARRAVVVRGMEHFFRCFGALVCIAVPIFGPDGSVAGILDASADFRAQQRHTRALLEMAATQIENGLFRNQHRGDVVIAFHPREEMLHSIEAGLVAVSHDAAVLATNVTAKNLLGAPGPVLGKGFGELFLTSFDDVLLKSRRQDRQLVRTVADHLVHAMVESGAARMVTQRKEIEPGPTLPSFVAKDTAVAAIVRKVEAAAARKIPTLIRGETGTGKEQLARHAHAASGRRGAFIPVNCAGLPASLIEAELFGYVDGAFTGARRGGAPGLVREADGGTLFLDEIGDMPVALQAVLLRFLDDWTARPIGGSGRKVDVFLISATNATLDRAIEDGRFRSDLLYRLNTLEVTLPPLAVRGDFHEIAHHLITALDSKCEITDGMIAKLANRSWPGNIRQLRNELARLSLGASDGLIDESSANDPTKAGSFEAGSFEAGSLKAGSFGGGAPQADETLRAAQHARILAAYAQSGGNISETARRLAISRNTVYRALERKQGKLPT